MITAISLSITVLALIAALWSFIKLVADRPVNVSRVSDKALLGVLALVEILTVVQCFVGLFLAFTTDRELSTLTFVLYLVGVPLIIPVATWWAMGDRTRAGAGVLTVGLISVPVMVLRMHELWGAGL
ncbi:hypothetical protein IEU95_06515 [Hoyosella rhizosphaerae]|uniref:Uncharacterized protein n=1 Tax=Hoyosella rhizosphaerae TaxID=1755582 RepID=A0A916U533_9ACTN|nr:hypothetical protein [Hoyosella rhizosphaerae]MBN4926474.1 hypothetical protein [Hoyosella rhizosphaerae]GGC59073.1 hypothetical protein GCM10011410_09380 [Hoyosella rhizosphaerae]